MTGPNSVLGSSDWEVSIEGSVLKPLPICEHKGRGYLATLDAPNYLGLSQSAFKPRSDMETILVTLLVNMLRMYGLCSSSTWPLITLIVFY